MDQLSNLLSTRLLLLVISYVVALLSSPHSLRFQVLRTAPLDNNAYRALLCATAYAALYLVISIAHIYMSYALTPLLERRSLLANWTVWFVHVTQHLLAFCARHTCWLHYYTLHTHTVRSPHFTTHTPLLFTIRYTRRRLLRFLLRTHAHTPLRAAAFATTPTAHTTYLHTRSFPWLMTLYSLVLPQLPDAYLY